MTDPATMPDTGAAEAYEKFLVPKLNGPLAAEMVALAELRPGERVLDVACGTGIVGRLAASCIAPGGLMQRPSTPREVGLAIAAWRDDQSNRSRLKSTANY